MNRFQAAGIHLGISLTIAALVGCLIYFVWYPHPYFQVAGGSTLMLLIMGVDIMIGPLLTLVVYKTDKKSLRFDLSCIAILQVCAFFYGFWVIAQARPVFIVAAVDRFIPVYANDIEDADLAQAKRPEFATRSWTGPRLVGAILPSDPKERSNLVFSGLAGKDLEKFPKYYVPYSEVAATMLAKSRPLGDLAAKSARNGTIIGQYLTDKHIPIEKLIYLPMSGRTDEYIVVFLSSNNRPFDALMIDPW